MVQKTEGKKTAEQKSTENKQTLRKPQNGSNGKAAGKNETSERTQQKREVKTAVNKAQQSREVKIVEKTAENAQPEKLSSSAKRRQRRKRAKAAREQAEAAGMVRGTAPQSKAAKPTEKIAEPTEKTVKPTEKRTVCHGKETDRQPRQVQPQTSMRIVTLSQPTGGWTAGTDKKETVKSEKSKKNTAPQLKRKSGEAEKRTQGNIAARQTQNEGAADPTARRRRRPKRRPAAEHAGNNVGRTAAGGGDHEE